MISFPSLLKAFCCLWAVPVVRNSICIGASYLSKLLKTNNLLQKLVMTENNIGNDGISSVAKGLQYNNMFLNLSILAKL